jgi:acetoin utilization deacetylase AcuC-like enzyme
MATALLTHPDCVEHSNGRGHPERPERLEAILGELDKPEYAALVRHEAPLATLDQIARVHDRDYIQSIFDRVPREGIVEIGGETALSPGSGRAALRAAGGVVAAVDMVLEQKVTTAFCAVRPPGHHAGWDYPQGFCLFNNIAIGAMHAFDVHHVKRIAILDFDVHHGNGTQTWAEDQPNVLFCSSHQWPFWPGSGSADDKGPLGNIINIPLPFGTTGEVFRGIMEARVLPTFDAFAPGLFMISAGFDAHYEDPMAGLRFAEDDYAWLTTEVCRLARKYNAGVVSTLEGGYNAPALARSVGAHVTALMEG